MGGVSGLVVAEDDAEADGEALGFFLVCGCGGQGVEAVALGGPAVEGVDEGAVDFFVSGVLAPEVVGVDDSAAAAEGDGDDRVLGESRQLGGG